MSKNEDEISFILDDRKILPVQEQNLETSGNNIVHSNEIALETANDLENELAKFRNEWKKELVKQDNDKNQKNLLGNKQSKQNNKNLAETGQLVAKKKPDNLKTSTETAPEVDYEQPTSTEEKAQYLFNKAVLLEQQGRHYEAIKFYRLSMQLDADIEFKVASQRINSNKSSRKNKNDTYDSDEEDDNASSTTSVKDNEKQGAPDNNDDEENVLKSLYEQFHTLTLSENKICERNYPQKATHFSDLPIEVIMLILKWVVSEHLDVRSLDNFAAVCKGFYVCARDDEIWKLASAKIWGANNIMNYLPTYNSWRNMFLKRPRLNFDGVYISKASYARAGERSLDGFYRPWHLVEYYRYLRFFPNGTVLFLTTPDEPKSIVTKLKAEIANSSSANNFAPSSLMFISNEHSVLKGTWTLALNKVSIVVCKKIMKQGNKYSRRQTNKQQIVEQEHIFRMELELGSSEKRPNNQLQWANYEIHVVNRIANTVNQTKFELNKIDFPVFYFSRVKSYSMSSSAPLK